MDGRPEHLPAGPQAAATSVARILDPCRQGGSAAVAGERERRRLLVREDRREAPGTPEQGSGACGERVAGGESAARPPARSLLDRDGPAGAVHERHGKLGVDDLIPEGGRRALGSEAGRTGRPAREPPSVLEGSGPGRQRVASGVDAERRRSRRPERHLGGRRREPVGRRPARDRRGRAGEQQREPGGHSAGRAAAAPPSPRRRVEGESRDGVRLGRGDARHRVDRSHAAQQGKVLRRETQDHLGAAFRGKREPASGERDDARPAALEPAARDLAPGLQRDGSPAAAGTAQRQRELALGRRAEVARCGEAQIRTGSHGLRVSRGLRRDGRSRASRPPTCSARRRARPRPRRGPCSRSRRRCSS